MITSLKTDYEKRLLNEIRSLPESELPKILKLIHFLKEEILETDEPKEEDIRLFRESFGSWEENKTSEEIIQEIYKSRESTTRVIRL